MPVNKQPFSLEDVPEFVDEVFEKRHAKDEEFTSVLREMILRIPKAIIDLFVLEVEKHSDRLGALVNYIKAFAEARKAALSVVG